MLLNTYTRGIPNRLDSLFNYLTKDEGFVAALALMKVTKEMSIQIELNIPYISYDFLSKLCNKLTSKYSYIDSIELTNLDVKGNTLFLEVTVTSVTLNVSNKRLNIEITL